MNSTVQRLRLIALMVVSILVVMIVGATLSPVSALANVSLNISPNPALPNQPVTFSGQFNPPEGSADNIKIFVFTGSSCALGDDIGVIPLTIGLTPSNPPPSTFTGTAQSDGTFSITAPSGFPVGTYAAEASDLSYAPAPVFSACDPFTVSTVIPEYPVGLAVLAVLMILAYGVMRRRTRYDYA